MAHLIDSVAFAARSLRILFKIVGILSFSMTLPINRILERRNLMVSGLGDHCFFRYRGHHLHALRINPVVRIRWAGVSGQAQRCGWTPVCPGAARVIIATLSFRSPVRESQAFWPGSSAQAEIPMPRILL
ncbi:hypothetical protein [Paraburkholderia gardini]|uniref:hypothetical protein n=1 Tax=Paraburkholderia gardini TaxID=2823469 RepID=UPI001E5C4AA2|nr:hypothetical protein [Paraburkholderia gardini]